MCQDITADSRTSNRSKLTSLVRPRAKIDKERESKRVRESEGEKERGSEGEKESGNKRGGLGALCAYGSSEEEEEEEVAGKK